MKKSFLLIVFAICVLSTTYAQSPFSYQAVIRNNSGVVLPNKNVGLRISIMQGATPAMVYREEFNGSSRRNEAKNAIKHIVNQGFRRLIVLKNSYLH